MVRGLCPESSGTLGTIYVPKANQWFFGTRRVLWSGRSTAPMRIGAVLTAVRGAVRVDPGIQQWNRTRDA